MTLNAIVQTYRLNLIWPQLQLTRLAKQGRLNQLLLPIIIITILAHCLLKCSK